MTESYLFDTYAIIEIIKGNINYKKFIDKNIVINNFIFSELCYFLFGNKYPESDKYLNRYKKFISSINPTTIIKAMKFRYNNKKKEMSMTDCISYFMAKELGIKFLTGDKEFENLENVEFAKK